MGPIRSVPQSQMVHFPKDSLRPINASDFADALESVKASVSPEELVSYKAWDAKYGCVKSVKDEED